MADRPPNDEDLAYLRGLVSRLAAPDPGAKVSATGKTGDSMALTDVSPPAPPGSLTTPKGTLAPGGGPPMREMLLLNGILDFLSSHDGQLRELMALKRQGERVASQVGAIGRHLGLVGICALASVLSLVPLVLLAWVWFG